MNLLKSRRKIKKKKPKFLRQEWFRHGNIRKKWKKWRAMRGNQSKLRKHIKGKGFIPNPGYGSPLAIKGLHPCGLNEVLISNLKGIEIIDSKKDCARIARTVGRKKRIEIIKIAKEKGIKVLNPQRAKKIEKRKEEKPKEKEEKPALKEEKSKEV